MVRPDGSGDYPTIQEAIEAAQGGDFIELSDGTFTRDGNRDIDFLGKEITVRSRSGIAELCVIDAQADEAAYHRVFDFHLGETRNARLEAVTVTGGHYLGHVSRWTGRGYPHNEFVSPKRCVISGNHAVAIGSTSVRRFVVVK